MLPSTRTRACFQPYLTIIPEASHNGQETVSRVESSDVGVDVVPVPTNTGTHDIPEHFCLIRERVVLVLERVVYRFDWLDSGLAALFRKISYLISAIGYKKALLCTLITYLKPPYITTRISTYVKIKVNRGQF